MSQAGQAFAAIIFNGLFFLFLNAVYIYGMVSARKIRTLDERGEFYGCRNGLIATYGFYGFIVLFVGISLLSEYIVRNLK